jgi:hypothetical protein
MGIPGSNTLLSGIFFQKNKQDQISARPLAADGQFDRKRNWL